MGFDPSDSAARYNDQSLRGGETSDLGYHWSSGSSWHGSKHDGKAKALQHIQSQLDDTALRDKAEAWGRIRDHAQTVHTKLQQAYTDAFSQWEGDDADRAAKTFGFAVASAKSVHDVADSMQQGTSTLASMATHVKGLNSSAPSGWGALGNTLLDTTTPGVVAKATGIADDTDGGGANLDPAVNSMSTAIAQATATMPSQVTWQVKTDPTHANASGNVPPPSTGGVGGVSAPGAGGGAAHETTPVSGIGKVKQLHNGTGTATDETDPPPIDRPDPWVPPTDGSGSDFGNGSDAPFTSGSAGTPGLDQGSSLAGYDPSGLGGGGAGGGGIGAGGGLGSGAGAGGLGSGAGGLGSAGGLAGAGVGGGANGAAAGGLAGAAAGQGGRPGAVGAQPMRGGGAGGGDESERERSTWLNEDDDVWGGTEAPPSVIS